MLVALLAWLIVGSLALWVVAPITLISGRKRVTGPLLAKDEWLFLTLWAAPSLLFFSLVHIPRAGYLLGVLPPMVLVIARRIVVQVSLPPRGSLAFTSSLLLACLVSASFFLAVPPLGWIPEPAENPRASVLWNKTRLAGHLLKVQLHSCLYGDISRFDDRQAVFFSAARKVLFEKPASAVIVFHEGNAEPNWRTVMYYFPDVPVYGVFGLSIPVRATFNRPGPVVVNVGFGRDVGIVIAGDTPNGSAEPSSLSLGTRNNLLVVIPSGSDIRLAAAPGSLSDVTPRSEDSKATGFTLALFEVGVDNTLTVTGRARSMVIHR
jgi:hypothetical protein